MTSAPDAREPFDPDLARLLTELVEKTGLLRRDLQHRGDLEHYSARVLRIEQKLTALVDHVDHQDPELAKALRTAWQLPARSLAFRNARHQGAQKTPKQESSTADS